MDKNENEIVRTIIVVRNGVNMLSDDIKNIDYILSKGWVQKYEKSWNRIKKYVYSTSHNSGLTAMQSKTATPKLPKPTSSNGKRCVKCFEQEIL